jgi:hypothetical protein
MEVGRFTTKIKKLVCVVVIILVAVFSITKVSDWTSDPANHEHSITQTEENISTVMKLSAGSAATSVAVTLLPGDVATPVANQLAEMSKYFLIILSALYLEKYLITLTGYIVFSWLVPIICALLIGYICINKEIFLKIAGKVALCALAIYLVIPVSVKFSDIIYQTQETTVDSTIEDMDNFEVETDESESILDKVTGLVTNAVDSSIDKATSLVTDLIESLAIMLTISCIIPLLVFVFFAWMIKMVFNSAAVHIDYGAIKKIRTRIEDE